MIEDFVKIVKVLKPLTIFVKARSLMIDRVLNKPLSSVFTSELDCHYLFHFIMTPSLLIKRILPDCCPTSPIKIPPVLLIL